MKKLALLVAFAVAGCVFSPVMQAAEEHGHEHKAVGGPKGGRLLDNTDPRAEFLVEKNRSMTITFYDDALKSVPAVDQSAVVVAGSGESKTRIEFEKKGNVLASNGALPEGESVNLVIQFKQSPEAKQQNFRMVYSNGFCETCKLAEYACICEH